MDIDSIDSVLFDLDGTIYYGSKIIPGANETINYFREHQKHVFFTTNNSTKTRRQIFERLRSMDIDCKFEEIITSGYLAALYAKETGLKDIYIFGSENLVEEFDLMDVVVNQDESAENLLIGYNPNMTYEGLTAALQVALHAKCIIACNRERRYPGENMRLMPGCGAMTAPIEWCAERQCDLIIGKPNTLMAETVRKQRNIAPEKVLVVGDTYESDIEMAKRAGCQSILLTDDTDKYTDTVTARSIGEVPRCFE